LTGGRSLRVGDLDGSDDAAPVITRQALHAERLVVRHPITEKPLELAAPLPGDMTKLLDLLARHRPHPAASP